MRFLLLFFIITLNCTLYSQVVFLETFDEADDATTGVDNTAGAVSWTTGCPGCLGVGDYFKVVSGELVAVDTGEPTATFTTGAIDISSCSLGLNISLSLNNTGSMEACVDCASPGSGCIDWAKLEYNIDGLGWNEVAGTTCVGLAAAPGEMIQIGILAGGPITITSPCVDIGSTLELRITCLSDQGDEFWYFDDITVECTDCLLPVKFEKINVTKDISGFNTINWVTLEQRAIDYFEIERSVDGINYYSIGQLDGAGNSSEIISYHFKDPILNNTAETTYYRLKQVDFSGQFIHSDPVSINGNSKTAFTYTQNRINYLLADYTGTFTLIIYDLNGTQVHLERIKNQGSIEWNRTGLFFIEIPELGLHEKIMAY